jgi:Protein of unknown function (DUF4232)
MKLTHKAARRVIAAAAIAGSAILLPAVALAASGSPAAAQAPAASRCTVAQLTDWVGVPGGATAGSTYYQLEISNISKKTCTLYGYPGVSALSGGKTLGSAAGQDPSHPRTLVTLRPGVTAHVILQITDVGNFSPSACRPTQAYTLKVYAPGAYHANLVQFSFQACSRSGPVYLHVTTAIAGTGIPGYSN